MSKHRDERDYRCVLRCGPVCVDTYNSYPGCLHFGIDAGHARGHALTVHLSFARRNVLLVWYYQWFKWQRAYRADRRRGSA